MIKVDLSRSKFIRLHRTNKIIFLMHPYFFECLDYLSVCFQILDIFPIILGVYFSIIYWQCNVVVMFPCLATVLCIFIWVTVAISYLLGHQLALYQVPLCREPFQCADLGKNSKKNYLKFLQIFPTEIPVHAIADWSEVHRAKVLRASWFSRPGKHVDTHCKKTCENVQKFKSASTILKILGS